MEKKLQEYARLLVEIGVNIQPGQNLVISCPVECAYFARLCARAAYAAGCREVILRWGDDALAREKYLHAAEDVFDTVPAWNRHFYNDYAQEGAAYLAISASDPENLKGVDPARLVRSKRQRRGPQALLPPADAKRLPLVHRLHPHPQLGGEGLSRRRRCGGQTVGRHLCRRPHHRRRHGGGQVARPPEDAGDAQGETQRPPLPLPPLYQRPGDGPHHPTAGEPPVGRRQQRHPQGPGLHRQYAHRGDLHRPPAGGGGGGGVRLHAPEPRWKHRGQVLDEGGAWPDCGGPRPDRGGDPAPRHIRGPGGGLFRGGGPGALRQPHPQPGDLVLQHPLR